MKYAKARRTYRRKPYAKKATKSTKKYIRKVAVSAVRRIAETKTYFTTISSTFQPLNVQFYAWNVFYNIGQGTGDNNRIGDKIQAKYAQIRMNVFPGGLASSEQQTTVRVLVVHSRFQASNGTLPVTWQLWSGDPVIKSGTAINGFVDTEKFTVVSDRRYQINPLNNTNARPDRYINVNIPLKNKSIQYNGDNSGYLKWKNMYVMVALYNRGNTITSTDVNIAASFRLMFKDL